jgi:hypothetical protein
VWSKAGFATWKQQKNTDYLPVNGQPAGIGIIVDADGFDCEFKLGFWGIAVKMSGHTTPDPKGP